MNYRQTLEYIYQQLPMFHRIGAPAYKADLKNTAELCKILGNPERTFKSIHIGGTNGKGSTSHLIASILQSAGYKTGLYTSPHLTDFRERIRINGEKIKEEYVTAFVDKYQKAFEPIRPSFFEYTVGMAFKLFSEEKVDIAVIEVGLGGRLDSTNIISPILSVITNIGYDHMAFLGESLEKIAAEKAGIIKNRIPIIIGESQLQTKDVFAERAQKKKSAIYFADQVFHLKLADQNQKDSSNLRFDVYQKSELWLSSIECPLTGNYQLKNFITVCQSVDILNKVGIKINESAIRRGFAEVTRSTGLQGRWQKLSDHPKIICDVGHNIDGLKYVVQQIESETYDHLHFVLGMVNDKDIHQILSILPHKATYYFCKANIPRGLETVILEMNASKYGLSGISFNSVKEAFLAAKKNAGSNDFIFVGGSTFIVAEVL